MKFSHEQIQTIIHVDFLTYVYFTCLVVRHACWTTGCLQMNGAVSKVNKKFISHLTRTKRTPSAAATVLVSHALTAVRFSCLLRDRFPRWRRSRKRLSVSSVLRCLDLWLQCTALHAALHHRSGHLKTEHTESLFLLRRHLVNWPRIPAVRTSERTAGSAWETWTVSAADGVRFARVRREINFLLTFETAPFICKHPVYKKSSLQSTQKIRMSNFYGFKSRSQSHCEGIIICYWNNEMRVIFAGYVAWRGEKKMHTGVW